MINRDTSSEMENAEKWTDAFIDSLPTKSECLKIARMFRVVLQGVKERNDKEYERLLKAKIRKIERRAQALNEMGGRDMIPKALQNRSLINIEHEKTMTDEIVIYDATKKNEPQVCKACDVEIEDRIKGNFETWESGFIMDTVVHCINQYHEHPLENVEVGEEYYKIGFTDQDFISIGSGGLGITPEQKEKVFNALFPKNTDHKGALETVTFIIKDRLKEGRRMFYTTKFIFADKMRETSVKESEMNGAIYVHSESIVKPVAYKRRDGFVLYVNKEIFDFMNHRREINSGKAKNKLDSSGFFYTPAYNQMKTDSAAMHALMIEASHTMDKDFRTLPKVNTTKQIGLRHSIDYTERKWQTGKENRKQPMTITYQELSEPGWFSKNTKNATRRHENLKLLKGSLMLLREDGEILQDSGAIEIRNDTLIISVKEKA